MLETKKIMIVDDEEDIRRLLKIRLEREGFELVIAEDGEIGLRLAEAEKPDLIVLDIVMPNMDGYTCLKELRKLPTTKDIPVIMFSGKEEDKVRDLFAFQKISAYIEKPFDLEDLINKIKEILKV
ncbi:MAG: response regulator [Candidatus Omnitrophota bacterium]